MSSKGTIVLLALLSSLLVTISESRATRAITDEEVQQNEAISEKPAAESSKNDQWSTDSDVIKADEMKLAFGVRLSDSTLTQPCKPSSFCNLNSNYKRNDCISLATCIVDIIKAGTTKRRVKVVEDCVTYRKCQYSCPQFLDNYFISLWCLIVEKRGTTDPNEACATIMKQKTC
ncbi:hypothetical protein EMCRGX_G000794 [Ephydatia muelleri]|eukprot:Em0001g629a